MAAVSPIIIRQLITPILRMSLERLRKGEKAPKKGSLSMLPRIREPAQEIASAVRYWAKPPVNIRLTVY
jgi:hypothetical protein